MPRVLGFYLIAAFTALQVAESLTSALDLPSWVPTLVAVLGIVGIPVVGVLAWVFDVTPDGVRRTSGAGGEAAASGGGRSWRIGAAVVAVVLGSWALTARLGDEPALRSDLVTVVPFRVSGEEVEYLGEGMVDLLAAKLTGEGGLRAVEPRTVLARWEGDGEGGA
ncbi:MAG: hypothetical protein KY466_17415, partial [Gemmatimonadetes bacterium]|nr:hypothetical protein [Gemmatimonadota bacterium]